MYKNERKDYYRNIVDDYKEISKRIVDIRMQMTYLEDLCVYDDIAFLEELDEKIYKLNEKFYEVKQCVNKQVEKL